MERLDSTIRFKPVKFSDPHETLILPVSSSGLHHARVRHAAAADHHPIPAYRRFMTGARIVPQQ